MSDELFLVDRTDQLAFFKVEAPADPEWEGMPEFNQQDLSPIKSIQVHFASWEDMEMFSDVVGQRLSRKTRSIWFPQAEIGRMVDKRFIDVP
ncbi:MAG: hypothetical protein ACRDGM_16390 [bacterium]